MPKSKVVGQFIGESSCGFVTDKEYQLKIFTVPYSSYIWVKDVNSKAICPYDSLRALEENWEIPSSGLHKISDNPVSLGYLED